jgi:hypothetical protein
MLTLFAGNPATRTGRASRKHERTASQHNDPTPRAHRARTASQICHTNNVHHAGDNSNYATPTLDSSHPDFDEAKAIARQSGPCDKSMEKYSASWGVFHRYCQQYNWNPFIFSMELAELFAEMIHIVWLDRCVLPSSIPMDTACPALLGLRYSPSRIATNRCIKLSPCRSRAVGTVRVGTIRAWIVQTPPDMCTRGGSGHRHRWRGGHLLIG